MVLTADMAHTGIMPGKKAMNESQTGRAPEKIDILSLLSDLLNRLKRFWWVILLLTLSCGAFFYFRSAVTYTPTYTADATVTVELENGTSTSNDSTTELMSSIFPHLLSSGILSDAVKSDLGLKSIPGTIRVTNIKGTNLLTITVTDTKSERSYRTLHAVLNNLPAAARYVVGQTTLTVIDDSGIPKNSGKASVVRGSLKKGLLLGFLIGLVLLVIYTLSTRTIRSEKELKKLFNIPFLGNLPYSRRNNKKSHTPVNIISGTAGPAYVEAVRTIRTRVERALGSGQVLMVTSTLPGEGKSTVAANLAIAMARKGHRVILADCDLRNPSQQEIFNLDGDYPGLEGVLKGKCTLRDALVSISDPEKNKASSELFLLAGKQKGADSVEILGSPEMQQALEEMKASADIVILDTPPSEMLMDAMFLAESADGVIYVVLSDFAKRRVIYHGVKELQQSGAVLTGCVLNGGTGRAKRYGYGYGYGYGYNYGYGSKENSVSESRKNTDS